jgi:hypothetical protein
MTMTESTVAAQPDLAEIQRLYEAVGREARRQKAAEQEARRASQRIREIQHQLARALEPFGLRLEFDDHGRAPKGEQSHAGRNGTV